MSHPLLDQLKHIPLFGEFTDEELAHLLELCEPRVFAAGQAIVRQGEPGNSMYLVATGTARVVLDREGCEVELATLQAGDIFGELALLDQGPRSASVIADRECTLMAVTQPILRQLQKYDPAALSKLLFVVLNVVGQRLRGANQRYHDTLLLISAISETESSWTNSACLAAG